MATTRVRLATDKWHVFELLNINRSKRSLTLNLKDDRGTTALKKIAATADVVVQNFRPGVVERLGMASMTLKR